jgi:hypothetical protein
MIVCICYDQTLGLPLKAPLLIRFIRLSYYESKSVYIIVNWADRGKHFLCANGFISD